MWGLLGGAVAVAIALFTWYNGGSEVAGGLSDAADGMSRHASPRWRFDDAWNNDPWTDDERRAQILRDGDGHQMVRAVGGVARVTLAAKSLAGSPSVPNAPAGLGFSDGQTISEIGVWAHGKLVGDASGDPTSEPDDPAESGTGADADGSARRPGATGEPADGTGTTPPTAHGTTDASDILGCYRFDVEAFGKAACRDHRHRRQPHPSGQPVHRGLGGRLRPHQGHHRGRAGGARRDRLQPGRLGAAPGERRGSVPGRRRVGLHRQPLRLPDDSTAWARARTTWSPEPSGTASSGSTSRTRWSGVSRRRRERAARAAGVRCHRRRRRAASTGRRRPGVLRRPAPHARGIRRRSGWAGRPAWYPAVRPGAAGSGSRR